MNCELIRLDRTGDTPILWNTNDPDSRREAADLIATLKSQGYLFFAVDGSEVDTITDDGVVHARKLSSVEVESLTEPAPEPKRGRGRPKKTKVIAAPALRGG